MRLYVSTMSTVDIEYIIISSSNDTMTMWQEVVKEKDNKLSLVNINFEFVYLWIYSTRSQEYGSGGQGKYVG